MSALRKGQPWAGPIYLSGKFGDLFRGSELGQFLNRPDAVCLPRQQLHHNVMITPERVGDSLRFAVGPRVNWLGVFTAALLILILFGAGIGPAFDGLRSAIVTGGSLGGYILGIAACSALILLVLYSLLLNLFGTEIITVSSTDLQIQSLICGFVRSQREFPNSTVEKLRYEQWAGRARGEGMHSCILFDCVGETVTFAQDLSQEESYDLIDQMRQVYAFPIPDPPEEETSPAVVKL
jgi:hypothetical protein